MQIHWPLLALFVVLGFGLPASADDLPPVDSLPSRPELPDPLVMLDGRPVTTAKQWKEERRPELVRLFQHYMYGIAPPDPRVEFRVTKTGTPILGGKAVLREIDILFPELAREPKPVIHLALFVPAVRTVRFPVILVLNSCGNQAVLDDPAITINANAWRRDHCKLDRGVEKDFWSIATMIDRGYAFATFHESDIDPDKPDFTDGIHAQYPDLDIPPDSRWGTIAAWAWGLSRAADYLVKDGSIDASKICVTGHSRRGKTALWAGAMDERFALVIPHQSGTGGMALSRNNDQETVERINRSFPHWFDDEFVKFGGREDRLPFDQHLLVALIAPRPLIDTEGAKDLWANYPRSLESIRAADKVYKLLGSKGIAGSGLIEGPTKITAENAGSLLQYRLDTVHTWNADYWNAILDFADVQFGRKSPASGR